MHLTLEQQSGSGQGRREILSPGQSLRIGRTEWSDFSVPDDPRLSSVHFEIRWDGRCASLRDLGSSNGTRVNGQPTSDTILANGDIIVAGQSRFCVSFSEPETVVPSNDPEISTTPEGIPSAPVPMISMSGTVGRGMAETLRDTVTPPIVSGVDDSYRPFSKGLADPEPGVRRAALLAAAWSRQAWLLDYCRRASEQFTPAAETERWLYGVLATPRELPRILQIGRAGQFGPRRFRLLGVFGHPGVIPDLLRAMHAPEARTRLAAGAAFELITGVEIASTEKIAIPPDEANGEDPDDFESEFQEESFLPDLQLATKYWEQARGRLEKVSRWRRGFDVSRFPSPDVLSQLDLPSRREVCLRGHLEGVWQGGPLLGVGYL